MSPRFIVHLPEERPFLAHPFVVDAASPEAVAEHFLPFAPFTILDLERERPGWLTDSRLEALGAHQSYELGAPEPRWLTSLLDHLVNGDTFHWYRLLERSGSQEIASGELGSWVPKGPGTVLLLPGSRRMVVAAVRPSVPPFESDLVLVETS